MASGNAEQSNTRIPNANVHRSLLSSLQLGAWSMAVLIMGLAIFSRFYMLTEKPIHFDEGINGWFSEQMRQSYFYKYDPENYHGPLYFYLLNWCETIFGESLTVLRLVPTLFGICAIGLFVGAGIFAQSTYFLIALALLLSPAFIFFSRSGIHEMPFVFFQLLFGLGINEWLKQKLEKNLIILILGLWGMMLLKETFAITVVGLFAAILCMGPSFWKLNLSPRTIKPLLNSAFWKLFFILGILFILFFTGFLMNPNGIFDFVKAFIPWMKTATLGNGHEKEFLYWIKLFWQTEPVIILSFIWALWGIFQRKSVELKFWSLFAASQLIIYSLIPYKTVWCMISISWPFYFVWYHGYLTYVLRSQKKICVHWVIFAIAIGLSAREIVKANYQSPLDFDHPFVYVNSTYTVKEVQENLDRKIVENPIFAKELVQMGMSEQWPWPWILRSFKNISYQECAKEILENAAIYFCEDSEAAQLEQGLKEPYWKVRAPLRQTKAPSVIYFKRSVFSDLPSENADLIGRMEK